MASIGENVSDGGVDDAQIQKSGNTTGASVRFSLVDPGRCPRPSRPFIRADVFSGQVGRLGVPETGTGGNGSAARRAGGGLRDRKSKQRPQGSGGGDLEFLGTGARLSASRPDQTPRGHERDDHPARVYRRRMGRYSTRRHDLQRDQELSFDAGGPGARQRPYPGCARSREDVRSGRKIRFGAQRQDHLAPPPPADLRLGGHALRYAGLGRSAGPARTSRSSGRDAPSTSRALISSTTTSG